MNVTTVKVAVDPISYAVRESISGRFGDWPIESIQGWMLGRGVPAEECDRVGTYIDADRMTVLLGRWWHNGHR